MMAHTSRPFVHRFVRRPGRPLDAFALTAVVLAVILLALGNLGAADRNAELHNVSYSTTGALYRDLNTAYERSRAELGARPVAIAQSHGGSSRQAHAILDSAPADIATLASFADVEALRKRGFLPDGWSNRLPHHSVPYTSTIVFVVRRGNPGHIHEFADLVTGDAAVVVPNPKTSGDGKLAFLAAWGSVLYCVACVDANVQRRGTEALARSYLEFLFTEPAQEIMATHHYRPFMPAVLERHRAEFPRIDLFPIGLVAADWEDAQRRFFDDNGLFDSIAPRRAPK
jgi:ABC-type sulfate transport system substrate-binding protein